MENDRQNDGMITDCIEDCRIQQSCLEKAASELTEILAQTEDAICFAEHDGETETSIRLHAARKETRAALLDTVGNLCILILLTDVFMRGKRVVEDYHEDSVSFTRFLQASLNEIEADPQESFRLAETVAHAVARRYGRLAAPVHSIVLNARQSIQYNLRRFRNPTSDVEKQEEEERASKHMERDRSRPYKRESTLVWPDRTASFRVHRDSRSH